MRLSGDDASNRGVFNWPCRLLQATGRAFSRTLNIYLVRNIVNKNILDRLSLTEYILAKYGKSTNHSDGLPLRAVRA